jgi:hypothetical protein
MTETSKYDLPFEVTPYAIDRYEDGWGVISLFDNTFIRSKEASKVIKFMHYNDAVKLFDILLFNYHKIVITNNASWTEKLDDNNYKVVA